jgi:hypothetical protein
MDDRIVDGDLEKLRRVYSDNPALGKFDKMMKEVEHFRKTHVPRCPYCHVDFVNAVDSVTGKVSKYLWKADCSCIKKNFVLSVG